MRKKSYSLKIFIFLFLLFGALSFLGYQWYNQTKENRYLADVQEIGERTNKKIALINKNLDLFQTEPQIAKEILPKFKEAEKVLRNAFRHLNKVKPLSKFKKLHRNLLELYLKSARLSGNLAKIAGYIQQREKHLEKLAKDSETFDKKVKEATTDEEMIEAAKLLRESTDETLNKLQSLEIPLKIYSSQKLRSYLKELSQSLELLKQAIEKKDIKQVEAAILRLNQVFSKDWPQALLELDSQDLKKYQEKVEEINQLKNQITQELSQLETE